jgi:hypothetical protein
MESVGDCGVRSSNYQIASSTTAFDFSNIQVQTITIYRNVGWIRVVRKCATKVRPYHTIVPSL